MKPWLHAFRLRTLPLALSGILVGSALAAYNGHFRGPVLALALLTAVLLQVLSNLANDLGDHEHGTDNADRVGPQRAVQSGAIAPAAMKRAMVICGLLALAAGTALIVTALGLSVRTLVFFGIGLLAIGAAVKYTYGRNPYGYAGLGDASVLLFFGFVGVAGTYYLHTATFTWPVLLPALAFGLLATGVLNTNNMRDRVNDAASGKHTLAVRLGAENAKNYHTVLIGTAFFALVLFTAWFTPHKWVWLFLLGSVPVLIHAVRVQANTDPKLLDPELKRLALGTLLTAVTFSIGLWLSA
ncbi:MAG: 1,4-dihydroxy-2-naphthoate polyprenyltransferase [Flavobacteriales bacterium]